MRRILREKVQYITDFELQKAIKQCMEDMIAIRDDLDFLNNEKHRRKQLERNKPIVTASELDDKINELLAKRKKYEDESTTGTGSYKKAGEAKIQEIDAFIKILEDLRDKNGPKLRKSGRAAKAALSKSVEE